MNRLSANKMPMALKSTTICPTKIKDCLTWASNCSLRSIKWLSHNEFHFTVFKIYNLLPRLNIFLIIPGTVLNVIFIARSRLDFAVLLANGNRHIATPFFKFKTYVFLIIAASFIFFNVIIKQNNYRLFVSWYLDLLILIKQVMIINCSMLCTN